MIYHDNNQSGKQCKRLEILVSGIFAAVIVLVVIPYYLQASRTKTPKVDSQMALTAISLRFIEKNGSVWLAFSSDEASGEVDLNLTADEIDARVQAIEAALESRSIRSGETIAEYQNRLAMLDDAYWKTAGDLSKELLGPVAENIPGKQIVIVAEGPTRNVNFAALPLPFSSIAEPILLTNQVSYGSSGNRYLPPGHISSLEDTMLIVADPVFSSISGKHMSDQAFPEGETRSTGDELIPQLPGTGEEAKYIFSLRRYKNTTLLIGAEADRNGVFGSDLTAFSSLHFATHGVVDERDPLNSSLLLSGTSQSKELNSIRVSDISVMSLTADLVVLSGCETGRGMIAGEEEISLKNAFLKAGARTVVSSLWKVDDVATGELMKAFYGELISNGSNAASALRRAQIRMFDDPRFRSPFYWGAFTVSER